jgi:molybdenum cofactor cytidylyltransferase
MEKIIAVVLAAGTSSRLGFSKLTIKIDGESVIRRSVKPFLMDSIHKVIVVTGNNSVDIEREMVGLNVDLIHNPHYKDGMSTSVKAALPYLGDAAAVIFHLGDKPLITSRDVLAVVNAYSAYNAKIAAPSFQEKMGHPVMINAALLRSRVGMLSGDSGLREIIDKHREDVVFIVGNDGNLFDIDTIQAIDQLRERGYRIEESKC